MAFGRGAGAGAEAAERWAESADKVSSTESMTVLKVARISLNPGFFDFEPATSAKRALTCLFKVLTAASRAARDEASATSRRLPWVSRRVL